MKSSILKLFVIVVIVAAIPASAADRGFYVGGGLGFPSWDAADFNEEYASLRFEEEDFGFKLFGGYRILKYLAVEASYNSFGSISTHEVTIEDRHQRLDVSIGAWDASAVGVLPVGKKVDFFGKLGISSWNADVKATDEGVVDDQSTSGTDVAFGLGIDFHIKKFAVRIEGDWLMMGDHGDAFMFSLNLAYFF